MAQGDARSELTSRLAEAKHFLRNYVVARHSKVTDDRKLQDVFFESLPDSYRKPSCNDAPPMYLVVKYCLSLITGIHASFSLIADRSLSNAIGSMDLQAVDMLVEIFLTALIRPFLADGLGSALPMNTHLKDLDAIRLCSPVEFGGMIERAATSLLPVGTPVSVSLRSSARLSLLSAAAIQSGFSPQFEPFARNERAFHLVVSSLEPGRLLQTMQILHTRSCPLWARAVIGEQLTGVLLRTDGLKHVSAFMLQPDDQGSIPQERFDHLATLVAAVPSKLSTIDYLRSLIPQIYEAFEDDAATGQIRRKAMSYILKRLVEVHKESSLIIEDLWEPVLTVTTSREACTRSLKRLSVLSSFSSLRGPLLHNKLSVIIISGYNYHQAQEQEIRDLLERLLYRLVEDDSTVKLIPALEDLMTLRESERSDSCTPHDYFCRILDQIKGDGAIIVNFLKTLLEQYSRPLVPVMQNARLRMILDVPKRFSALVFDASKIEAWLNTLNGLMRGSLDLQDHTIVLLGVLKCLVDTDPHFSAALVPKCQATIAVLSQVQQCAKSKEVRQSAQAIAQRLELLGLQAQATMTTSQPLSGSTVLSVEAEGAQKKYRAALHDMGDDMIPNRAHGLFLIGELATSEQKDIVDVNTISSIILGLLGEDEPFVHHNAIKAMKKMKQGYGERYSVILKEAMSSERYPKTTRERISVVLKDDDGS